MGINEIIQVGNQIRKYRKKRGLSQKAVSELTGIPYSTYSNYENNNREPSIEQLKKIAEVLQVPIINFTETGYIMGLKETELRIGLNGMKLGIVPQAVADFLEDDEYNLLKSYYKLNDEGKAEAIKRVEELTEVPRYFAPDFSSEVVLKSLPNGTMYFGKKKEDVATSDTPIAAHNDHAAEPGELEKMQADAAMLANAAHPRADVTAPEGTDTSDNDIMDDENF